MNYLSMLLAALLLAFSSLAIAENEDKNTSLDIIAFIPAAESVVSDAVNSVNPNVGSGAIAIPVETTAQ